MKRQTARERLDEKAREVEAYRQRMEGRIRKVEQTEEQERRRRNRVPALWARHHFGAPGVFVWTAITLVVYWTILGSVIAQLWSWYVAAPFGVPEITWPEGLGLFILGTLVVDPDGARSSRVQLQTWATWLGAYVLSPLVYLLAGYVARMFL